MQEISAYIINKRGRKFWYVKYQTLIDSNIVEKEKSTKVLKTEKSLTFMQSKYLPGWIAKQLNTTTLKSGQNQIKRSFGYYASIYLKECESLHNYKNIEYQLKKVLIDFADLEIRSITILQVRLWIDELVDKRSGEKLAKRTKIKYKGIFRGVFQQAVDDSILDRNIVDDIKIKGKKNSGEEVKPFFHNEVSKLLEISKNPIYGNDIHDYLGIAFNQGMSPSEIIGLHVSNIDLVNKTISIERNVTKGKVKSTKNDYRTRTIRLFDSSLPYIQSLVTKSVQKKSLWLFSDPQGLPLYDIGTLRGTRLITKNGKTIKPISKWYKLLSDCRIEYRDLKNCRHTFAVAGIESNQLTFQEIADILGHNSLKMLFEHYAKWIKGKGIKVKANINLFQ